MSGIPQVSLLTVRRSPANTRRVGAAAIIVHAALTPPYCEEGSIHAGMVDIYIHVYVNSWVHADFNNVISRTCVRHCDGASASVVRQACVMPQVQHFGAKVRYAEFELC